MSWVKIDNTFFSHPKARRAGPFGRMLFLSGVCYASRYLTDGYIPIEAMDSIAVDAGVKNPNTIVNTLVTVGLWEEVNGGYMIHQYLDYNQSSDKVHSKREAAKQRMASLRSQNVRANKTRSSRNVRSTDTDTDLIKDPELRSGNHRKPAPEAFHANSKLKPGPSHVEECISKEFVS